MSLLGLCPGLACQACEVMVSGCRLHWVRHVLYIVLAALILKSLQTVTRDAIMHTGYSSRAPTPSALPKSPCSAYCDATLREASAVCEAHDVALYQQAGPK